MKKLSLVFILFLCLAVNCSAKNQLTIFAAASLKEAVEDLTESFAKNSDTEIKLNFASSGQLAQQIVSGAPADIYLSADMQWVNFLLEKNFALASDSFEFCSNRLAIISHIDSSIKNIDLNRPDLKIEELFSGRLVIGDPEHVPGGKYAHEFLQKSGWLAKLENRLLPCVSIREALMLIEMNEWQLGIVFYSDCMASKKVKLLAEIPASYHSEINYGCALIKESQAARAFCNFLKTDSAEGILKKHYFFPIKMKPTTGD